MANNENLIPIPGRLHSVATEGHVSGADEIYDDTQQKDQKTINSELIAAVGTGGSVDSRIAAAVNVEKTRAEGAEEALDGRVNTLEEAVGTGGSVDSRISAAVATETTRAQAAEADRYTKAETYNKSELNNMITTPNQEYVSVTATDQTTAVTDVLPATGAADTTYRIGNWDGTQYNDSVFCEYAWNGSTYIKLSTKSQVGEVYDISANHADTKYADLTAALNGGVNIPQSLRKGGMSVKFVQSSDNKYVQFRYMGTETTGNPNPFFDVNNWSFCGEDVLIDNPEFIEVTIDAEGKVSEGSKPDGTKYIAGNLEVGGKIINQDLQERIDDAVEAKVGGLDKEALSSFTAFDNQEYQEVTLDSDDGVLEGITAEARKKINIPIDMPSTSIESIENPEWFDVTVDFEGKVLGGIKKDSVEKSVLPIYYLENNYIDSKIRLINEKIRECSNNGDAFFWITDIHWESDRNVRNSPFLIDYIRERTNIPRLFNGGDNFDGIEGRIDSADRRDGFDGNIDVTNKLRKAMNSNKVYTVYGNHEVFNGNTYADIFYALRQHNDDVVYGDDDKTYFYVDNKQQKIRYIILNAFGRVNGGVSQVRNEFKNNPEQLDWLMGTALNLDSEWTCILFIHSMFAIGTMANGFPYAPQIEPNFNSRKVVYNEPHEFVNVWIDAVTNYSNDKIGEVIDHDPRPLDGQGNIDISLAEIVTSVPPIADKIMLYSPNDNNTYNKYIARIMRHESSQTWRLVWTLYGTFVSDESHNIGDDIVIWKGFAGKIAGVFQGHSHADRMHVEAGVPFIISACDKWNPAGANDLTTSRIPGTLTEQHFEVAVLNKNLQKWTFISIGAPASGGFDDNIGEDVQVREVSYQSRN